MSLTIHIPHWVLEALKYLAIACGGGVAAIVGLYFLYQRAWNNWRPPW